MSPIPISDARRIATERRMLGVLVLGFDTSGNFVITSYGHNRPLCDAMSGVSDADRQSEVTYR